LRHQRWRRTGSPTSAPSTASWSSSRLVSLGRGRGTVLLRPLARARRVEPTASSSASHGTRMYYWGGQEPTPHGLKALAPR
jgi:hypothetical protein